MGSTKRDRRIFAYIYIYYIYIYICVFPMIYISMGKTCIHASTCLLSIFLKSSHAFQIGSSRSLVVEFFVDAKSHEEIQ